MHFKPEITGSRKSGKHRQTRAGASCCAHGIQFKSHQILVCKHPICLCIAVQCSGAHIPEQLFSFRAADIACSHSTDDECSSSSSGGSLSTDQILCLAQRTRNSFRRARASVRLHSPNHMYSSILEIKLNLCIQIRMIQF